MSKNAFYLLQAVKVLNKAAKESQRNVLAQQRDLFVNPLSWNSLNRYDAIIVNPPRIGARQQCIELKNTTPSVIRIKSIKHNR